MESPGGKLRDKLLACAMFDTMPGARIPVESWRRNYNRSSPHSALGYRGAGNPLALLLLPTVRDFGTFNSIYWQFDLLVWQHNRTTLTSSQILRKLKNALAFSH